MKLLENRVLIDPISRNVDMPAGLVAPDNAIPEPEVSGRVVSLGSKCRGDVQPGEVVLFSPHAGHEVSVAGKRYIVIREEEILAVLEEE